MHLDIILTLTIAWTIIADCSNSQKSNRRFSHDSANANNNASSTGIHGLHHSVNDHHHASSSTGYGVQLPSFAFDYSEFFSGAIIERSPVDVHGGPTDAHEGPSDLHLTMFLVGHSTMHNN